MTMRPGTVSESIGLLPLTLPSLRPTLSLHDNPLAHSHLCSILDISSSSASERHQGRRFRQDDGGAAGAAVWGA